MQIFIKQLLFIRSPVKLEEKDVTAEGFMKEDIFHITKIAPCLTEHKES